jgi:hypothetical protein
VVKRHLNDHLHWPTLSFGCDGTRTQMVLMRVVF